MYLLSSVLKYRLLLLGTLLEYFHFILQLHYTEENTELFTAVNLLTALVHMD